MRDDLSSLVFIRRFGVRALCVFNSDHSREFAQGAGHRDLSVRRLDLT